MLLPTLLSVVVITHLRALWVRRMTWESRWECGQSLALVFQCAAILLVAPTGLAAGRIVRNITGIGHLGVWVGHSLYVCACVAMLANVMSRVTDTRGLRDRMKRHVETIAPPAIALMFAAFVLSDNVDRYACQFVDIPPDAWLTVYWLLASVVTGYLMLYIARCLRIVRDQDPRSRVTAKWQLAAVYIYLLADGWMLLRILVRPIQTELPGAPIAWTLVCLSAALLAMSSLRSWREKVRGFNNPQRAVQRHTERQHRTDRPLGR
ncbi:hypothetical protein SEA_REPTAR3000_44 [Mycobacterium phage Reptar3000]|nr:hypothetical protein SEA_REPTAR3000_44 [Mycobacterium phage Reptar3000]